MVDRPNNTDNDNADNTIAAIDLGSNSFHLLLAREVDGHLQIIDRMKDMVQLAAGLDERRRLDPKAQTRALNCLARFGQRLRDLPKIVATAKKSSIYLQFPGQWLTRQPLTQADLDTEAQYLTKAGFKLAFQ